MKYLKASTKSGKNMIDRASFNEGYFLSNVYTSFSSAKLNAWEWCEHQYLISENHSNFRIISYNTFGFSVAWECMIDGEKVTRVETSNNTYIVWLER